SEVITAQNEKRDPQHAAEDIERQKARVGHAANARNKTIIIARFMPIIRTFAPFVAGIGRMTYSRFLPFDVFGGVLWISLFILGGYYFGNIPVVRRNFSLVILAIIVVSILPGIIEVIRNRKGSVQTKPPVTR